VHNGSGDNVRCDQWREDEPTGADNGGCPLGCSRARRLAQKELGMSHPIECSLG